MPSTTHLRPNLYPYTFQLHVLITKSNGYLLSHRHFDESVMIQQAFCTQILNVLYFSWQSLLHIPRHASISHRRVQCECKVNYYLALPSKTSKRWVLQLTMERQKEMHGLTSLLNINDVNQIRTVGHMLRLLILLGIKN